MDWHRLWPAALAAAMTVVLPQAGAAAPLFAGEEACTTFIVQAERQHGIPDGLLSAIALTESGMDGQPYPWALNIAGQAHMADSYGAAARLLRGEDGRPRQDAAVGCMQIHMRYHLASVQTPEWILRPRNNVLYAAAFLRRLYEQYGTWPLAVGHYNASDPLARNTYLCQVTRALRRVAPQTATAFAFPAHCAVGSGWGAGGMTGRAGSWGRVVVGVAAPSSDTAVLKGGSRQAGPEPRMIKADGGSFCAISTMASGAGPAIVRAGRCGAKPSAAQRSR